MTNTLTPRAAVVQAARAWLGTPYHHQARLKSTGCDCIGLVIGVSRELGLVPACFDICGYSRMPDGKNLMAQAAEHMTHINWEDARPGDVVVVSFDAEPQHFGILGDYRHGGLSIIHAASNTGRVIETRLMFSAAMQFVAAFELPGVC